MRRVPVMDKDPKSQIEISQSAIRNLKTCPERAKRVEWIADVVVPVVQRTERRLPKAKTAFLQESPNDIRSTQLAVFEVVD